MLAWPTAVEKKLAQNETALIEENMLIGKPIEPISNWLISMYLRMVLVQELAQASPGQKKRCF